MLRITSTFVVRVHDEKIQNMAQTRAEYVRICLISTEYHGLAHILVGHLLYFLKENNFE